MVGLLPGDVVILGTVNKICTLRLYKRMSCWCAVVSPRHAGQPGYDELPAVSQRPGGGCRAISAHRDHPRQPARRRRTGRTGPLDRAALTVVVPAVPEDDRLPVGYRVQKLGIVSGVERTARPDQ